VELLKFGLSGGYRAIAEDAALQVVFAVALAFSALWAADRLLQSRTLAILVSLAALVVVLWLTVS
jgi:hypothetical protein